MGKRRILLVEDDARFREDFARALERALASEPLDVAFVGAGSLAEARARLREGGLDAALIDVGLPDGDGLDLVGEIRDGGVGRPLPTLVLTAYLDHRVAAQAMDLGAHFVGFGVIGGFNSVLAKHTLALRRSRGGNGEGQEDALLSQRSQDG